MALFGSVTVMGDLTTEPPGEQEDRWVIRAEKK